MEKVDKKETDADVELEELLAGEQPQSFQDTLLLSEGSTPQELSAMTGPTLDNQVVQYRQHKLKATQSIYTVTETEESGRSQDNEAKQ